MQNTPPYEEKYLLHQVANGSEQAFRELFQRYHPKLYTYLLRLSRSKQDAEDIVHDVFIKIWEVRAQLPEIESFDAYLFRMAHNRAYTCFQRRSKETMIIAVLEKEQSDHAAFEGEDRMMSAEVRDSIKAALDKLTPQQKQVFLLSRQEGLSHNLIAERLGIAVRTVKNHMTEALRILREEMNHKYGSMAIAIFVLHGL